MYTANVLYGHNQPHIGLHRHVTSPRLLSPSFVRPSVTSPAQIRLLHEQAVTPSHIYAQQLRQDFAGMATMFPYTFTHPLPRNQLLTSHFKKFVPELGEGTSNTEEVSEMSLAERGLAERGLGERGLAEGGLAERGLAERGRAETPKESSNKENEPNTTDNSSSPNSESISSPKHDDKSRSSSVENLKFCNEEGESESNAGAYSDLASVAAQWDIDEVCKFVSSVTGCSEYCDVFREQEIDGQALLLLTEEHLSNKMGLKLGPALKLKSKIDELRCVYTK